MTIWPGQNAEAQLMYLSTNITEVLNIIHSFKVEH